MVFSGHFWYLLSHWTVQSEPWDHSLDQWTGFIWADFIYRLASTHSKLIRKVKTEYYGSWSLNFILYRKTPYIYLVLEGTKNKNNWELSAKRLKPKF